MGSEPTRDTRPERPRATLTHLREEDERRRNRTYARMELGIVLVAAAVVPFTDGDPTLRTWALASLLASIPGLAALQVLLRRPRYHAPMLLLAFKAPVMAVIPIMLAYLGAASPAMLMMAGGVAYYSQLSDRWVSRGTVGYIAVVVSAYLVSVSLGVLPDRSLFQSDARPLVPQVVVLATILASLGVLRFFARASRRSAEQAAEALERALLEVGRKRTLLAEAHQDLEQALGGRGRYSGQKVGPWVLGRVLGRGGMGEVYEARDEAGEAAAVKLLSLDPGEDPAVLTRFRREAEVLERLDCPNVVRLRGVGESTAGPWLAMELLEGEDLGARLRQRSRLTPAEVDALVADAAAGLEAARQADIVHRDLKPQNLFFDQRAGRWKVLDFGISKLGGGGTLTAGMLLGTPGYLAPEQASGGAVDHRADVFSLAVIAYRALTGWPAFAGGDPAVRVFEVLTRQPPRPSALAVLHPDVDAALAVGLAKQPAERFATAAELSAALAAAIEGRLDLAVRARAAALLERHSWGETSADGPTLPTKPS